MSNRHPYESHSIELLMQHFRDSGFGDFQIAAEHVPVGQKDCDYLLDERDGSGRRIAVEIVRVVDNEAAMEMDHFRDVYWQALKRELGALGVEGILVETPWRIRSVPRDTIKIHAPNMARRISEALERDPSLTVSVEGHEVTRIPNLSGVVHAAHSDACWVNHPALAELFVATLEKKDAQLALPNVERILLTVAWNTSLSHDAIAREIARRPDLHRLRHIDRVLFMDRSSGVETVYSRAVRDFFGGTAPYPDGEAKLASTWFVTRLTDKAEGAFELVSKTFSSSRSLDFLSLDGKEALAHHGTHLTDHGRFADALWIIEQLRIDEDPPPASRPSSGGICTVRGSTAWLTHRLASEAQGTIFEEAVRIAGEFLKDPNVYVREMSSFAVRALMARRDSLQDGKLTLTNQVRSDIQQIWRGFLQSAHEFPDEAARTLDFVMDLEEQEVLSVIDRFVPLVGNDGARCLARFALYFGYFRPSDSSFSTPFDASAVRARLQQLIADKSEFRDAAAYVVFRSMKDNPETRVPLAAIVPLFLKPTPDEYCTGFAIECVAMIAAAGTLEEATDAELVKCLRRARGLSPQVRMGLAYRLAEAFCELSAVGEADRLARWCSSIDDPELEGWVEDPRGAGACARWRDRTVEGRGERGANLFEFTERRSRSRRQKEHSGLLR